jgi:hypothetical protein
LWLNKEGVIPDASVHKKGQQRENPFRDIGRFDAANPISKAGDAVDVELKDPGEEDGVRMDKKSSLEETEG